MLLRYLRTVALVAAGTMAATGAIVYLFPPATLERYATMLSVGGGGLILLGLFSVVGGWNVRGDWRYVISQSTSDQRLPGRVAQTMRDVGASYYFLLVMLLAGGVCVGLGTLLQLRTTGG